MIKLDTAFSLTGTPAAFLTYWAKWDIEEGWDYAQILIKKEGENTWHPLTGKYTTLGNDHQAEGEPLYDGTQNEWVKEEISLSDYLGETIRIAFSLHSDGFITEDGFYFDDLKLSIIGSITGIDKNRENNTLYFSEPFPNPALENISVHYDLKELKMAHYQLLDLSGKIIKQGELYAGRHSITIKTENLTSGIYLLKFKTSAGTITKKVVIR
jgi:bacillopeptidase F (M6 metalloprotease family)